MTKYTLYGPNGSLPRVTASPSRQAFATALKQPVNAPPLDSLLVETNSVKNQCPPLLASYRQEMSPPLLQPLLVSPMRVSSGMTCESRWSLVLKIRISPMLLASTM